MSPPCCNKARLATRTIRDCISSGATVTGAAMGLMPSAFTLTNTSSECHWGWPNHLCPPSQPHDLAERSLPSWLSCTWSRWCGPSSISHMASLMLSTQRPPWVYLALADGICGRPTDRKGSERRLVCPNSSGCSYCLLKMRLLVRASNVSFVLVKL